MEQFGLEGTFKGHLVQCPCNEQGYPQLERVAHSPVKPDLECFQGNISQFVTVHNVKQFVLLTGIIFSFTEPCAANKHTLLCYVKLMLIGETLN